jgi:membrane protein DedA with SNARE-associated domain
LPRPPARRQQDGSRLSVPARRNDSPFNFVAAGLWSGVVVSAGYAFGQFSEKSISDASSGLGAVMLIAFLDLAWFLTKKLEQNVARS